MSNRSFEDMQPELTRLASLLDKYARISRTPVKFGGGEALYPQEIHMVSAVARHRPVSVSDLAALFNVTKGAASQMVAKLEAKGLVSKQRDPDKKSRLIIKATPKGIEAHEAHVRFHQEHDRAFFDYLGGLCTRDYAAFSALCREMDRWMDAYLT